MNKLIAKCVEKSIQPQIRKTKKLNLVSKKHFVISIHGVHGPIAQKHVVVEKEPEIGNVHQIRVAENHRRLNFATHKCVYHNGALGTRLVIAPRKSVG